MTYLYLSNVNYINGSLIVTASVGILTFISIFYSLLISKSGKEMQDNIFKIITTKENDIKSRLKIITKEYKDSNQIIEDIKSIEKDFKRLNNIKNSLDLDYILLVIVAFLYISTIFGLFNSEEHISTSYIFFAGGITLSFILVLIWALLKKINNKYMNIAEKDKKNK